ncbi:site-specific integrase [Marinilabilia salmonicolor]|uniref:site-specific integrase n=1 Tax=Marinilabilia salmonicolor TaxID=989 RepID=UPI00029A3D0C|nr:site-specific integrase [Marinilabilia salmonicolor]
MHTDYLSFEDLTKAASEYLEGIKRSKQTIIIYNWIWRKIKLYMDSNGIVKCSSDVITGYLKITYGSKTISQLSKHQKHCLRCALCLAQFAETGKMIEIISRREPLKFTGKIGSLILQYVEYKRSMRLSSKTLRNHSWYLHHFFQYLNGHTILTPSQISPLEIMNYSTSLFPSRAGAKHLTLSLIRSFLRYLYDLGKTRADLSLVVPRDNYKKQPKLPSTYTRDEVSKILGSVDRSTANGKRGYAVLMLATRLGMRASDISSLEFGDILWSTNTISFKQFKTGETVELLLPAEVGEAIIDYIKYARPASESRAVFLYDKFPNASICPKAVSRIASTAILKSGIDIGERKHGSHALRHTMAGFLLENKTPLPVISELLGHKSTQSSMCYLRIDIESLRQCALDVPPVPESFYMQKGGVFYG